MKNPARFDVKTCMVQEKEGRYVDHTDYSYMKAERDQAFSVLKKWVSLERGSHAPAELVAETMELLVEPDDNKLEVQDQEPGGFLFNPKWEEGGRR
jgi:hypothetical protein